MSGLLLSIGVFGVSRRSDTSGLVEDDDVTVVAGVEVADVSKDGVMEGGGVSTAWAAPRPRPRPLGGCDDDMKIDSAIDLCFWSSRSSHFNSSRLGF